MPKKAVKKRASRTSRHSAPKRSKKTTKKSASKKKAAAKKASQKKVSEEALQFPKGFLWGTATSAHQVEGNNINNDWWSWEQKKGSIENDDVSGKAVDHYNRYEEDYDWVAKFNHDIHRLSIEWSRIQPEEDEWNWEEVEHYRSVLQALKKRKVKAMVTLHHFTLPQWLAKKGGWECDQAPQYFAAFAEFIAEHLGEYIHFWTTLNEPVIYVEQCYLHANWPPQKKSRWAAYRALKNLAKGHKEAYREIHAEMKKQNRKAQVGIANNMISLVSYHNRFIDYLIVRVTEYLWNQYFYSLTKQCHDFLGVNYYLHQRLYRAKGKRYALVDVKKEHRESSDLGWEVFAPGIFEALMELKKYNKPIYITENGIAAVDDEKRVRFIIAYLKEIYHAIQAGVDVRGYIHWSLLDNFEWDKGFTPRFGLIHINYKTLKRTPRPSAYVYAEICRDNAIEPELLKYLGHGVTLDDIMKKR